MKIKPSLQDNIVYAILILALTASACNPGKSTLTPAPVSPSTPTLTLPPPQFPDTPTPVPPTDTPVPTDTSLPPTATPPLYARNWKLNFFYQKATSDDRFEYDESLNGTATFSLDSNDIISGDGSGAYNQGLKSKIPTVVCGFPLSSPTSFKITGDATEKNAVAVFHMQIAITFQSRLSTDISCGSKAAGINISISVSGSGDILTQRATSFPWNDFYIPPGLGLMSQLISGEGIDWKKTGGGELTIRINPIQ